MLGLYGLTRRDLKLKSELNEKFDYEDPSTLKGYNQMYLFNKDDLSYTLTGFSANQLIPENEDLTLVWNPCGLLDNPSEIEFTVHFNQTKAMDAVSSEIVELTFATEEDAMNNAYRIHRANNRIYAYLTDKDGDGQTLARVDYKSIGNIWIKLHYVNDSVKFMYSSNGSSFTAFHTQANALPIKKIFFRNRHSAAIIYGRDIKVKANGKYLFNFE